MIAMVVGWSVLTGSAGAFAADLTGTGPGHRSAGRGGLRRRPATARSPAGRPSTTPTALRRLHRRLAAARDAGDAPAVGSAITVLPADELPPTALGSRAGRRRTSRPERCNAAVRTRLVLLFEARCGRRLRPALVAPAPAQPGPPARRHPRWRSGAWPALVLLGVSLAAPQLTDSYGLLRLYQQLLPILGVAVVVALMAACAR